MVSKILLFLIFLIYNKEVFSACEVSYVVLCDDLEDIKKYETEEWREVVIGSHKYQTDTPIHSMERKQFKNFDSLRRLTIINQLNSIISPISFAIPITKLEYLNLYGNHLQEIPLITFGNHGNTLRTLNLVNNKIEYLGSLAFRGSIIEILDLSHNKISTLKPDIFTNCDITWLILTYNRISTINSNTFPNKLSSLQLDHNELEYLTEGTFDNLIDLRKLTMSHNRLSSIASVANLENLTTLDVSFNNIYSIKTELNRLEKMTYINLSNNKIRNVQLRFLYRNKTSIFRKMAILSFNQLTSLNLNDLLDLKRKPILILYGNPWNCQCLNEIEKTLKDYRFPRDTCDTDFFNSGQTPFCIAEKTCNSEEIEEEVYRTFMDSINKRKQYIPCDLNDTVQFWKMYKRWSGLRKGLF